MSDMMNEKKKPVYPTLEEGTYAEDVERGIAEAEKKAAEIERQAKRDRDMALIGDMAHLVSQGAAMHGGAWKIGQAQNEGAKGNERLRQLREKNAAQTAAFAKERAALMETKRKEENAQKLAKYNAELEQYKRDLEAEKYAKEQERKDRQEALKEAETASTIAKNQASTNYYNSGGRSGKEKNMRYLGDWGFDIDSAVDVDEAYYKLISSNPEFKVTEDRSIAEGGGEKLVKNPNTAQKRAKLIESGLISREPKKTAPAKKANPMGSGKKTNPMN
jgi:hypothetical protein